MHRKEIRELRKLAKLANELSKYSYDLENLKPLLEALLPYEKDIQRMIEQRWEEDIRWDEVAAFDIAPQYVTQEIAEKYSKAYHLVPDDSQIEDMILKGHFGAALDYLVTESVKASALEVKFDSEGSGKPSYRWWITITGLTPEEQALAEDATKGETDDFDSILLPKILDLLPEEGKNSFNQAIEGGWVDIHFDSDLGILQINKT